MPTIAQTISQLLNNSAYQGQGAQWALRDLSRRIALEEWASDDVDYSTTQVASATASAVVTSGAANLYACIITTTGSACYVQCFDTAAATTGPLLMRTVFPCAATTTTTYAMYPKYAFANGLSMSITTTAAGTTAVGTLPSVTLIYRTSTTPLF